MDYYLFRGGVSRGNTDSKNGYGKNDVSRFIKRPQLSLRLRLFFPVSPWLSNGCLSPREIYWEIKDYETKHGANESTYWLVFELLWRDFFISLHDYMVQGFSASRHTP